MAQFNVISQFLKDLSFESPNVPELFFKQENAAAKIELNVDIQVKGAEGGLYMVDLVVKVLSKLDEGDKTIFMIDCTYSGLAQLEKDAAEEDVKKVTLIDVPTLLFPSVRALVTRLTSESGFPPFTMQPVDFQKLYEEKNK
ncbi:MAG: protein-export chaperone SecB [Alphaproteobacteria bacterium]|nr:protein-export chaperone SecB [Alphaproteobacteria bacterium]MCL2890088.1 protein-export chaperone SecB [Alphaproteobacteria bacterium]